MEAVALKDIWLKYRIEFRENGKVVPEDFPALKGVSLSINKGESVCLIGDNGAGKTSLLKVIGGMLKPDSGSVRINGTVSGLMEIGAGFHKDLTGKENIYLISYLFGLDKKQIDARYNDIVKFAAIGRFINAPVKSYSQGMYMRLGFAIAIHVEPDILLIDDTFAVGDIYTQRKCINKIFELREKGKTIVFVTHDLEMAKRMCSRGVFLRDGEVIKAGSMSEVWSYYIETVGNKKGIAILQEGRLGVVFNNGRLIFRWADSAITTNLSGHGAMLFLGQEYLSVTADWRVSKLSGEKGFIAVGRWPGIPVMQYWKIVLLNNKELSLEIVIHAKGNTLPEKYVTRTVFTSAYKYWFSASGEQKFPEQFVHAEQWQCNLIDDSLSALVGLKSNYGQASELPAIVFDRTKDNLFAMCYIGNTGSDVNGRILQYVSFPKKSNTNAGMNKYRCFLGTVRIFGPEDKERLESYINYTRMLTQQSKIIRKEALSIFCKERQMEIYWHDKLLTRGPGLNTEFMYQNKDYRAVDGNWIIRKENEEEATVTILWNDNPPFKQLWRIRLLGNNTISWEIVMEASKEVSIRNKQTKLMLVGEYEKWVIIEESGDFKRPHKSGTVILNKSINNFMGLDGVYDKKDIAFPAISFSCEDALPRAVYISKIKEEALITKLVYLEIDLESNLYRNEYFKGVIKIDVVQPQQGLITAKDGPLIIRKSKDPARMHKDRLSFVFDGGKGRIFWQRRELTSGLGLYTSIALEDRWVDSSQAFWRVQELDKVMLVTIGYWPWVPFRQTWEISILDERMIFWRIIGDNRGDAVLRGEQVNLMVSSCYKEWFAHKDTRNEFPEEFMSHNGISWNRLWQGDGVLPIGVIRHKINKGIFNREFMPTVIFESAKHSQEYYSAIENTDDLFRSRVLHYETITGQHYNIDNNKHKHFEAKIKIAAS